MHGNRPQTVCRRSIVRLGCAGLTLAMLVVVSTGCRKTLFNDRHLRHQFQAYELTRNQYVPLEEPDVFGNPQPALRARLAPDR